MRKIEAQMIEAIVAKKRYSKGNTLVEVETDGTIKVYLHSNLIAEITKSEIWLELHWTAIQILDLHNYSSGVTYGETFFCLEYEGTNFAELTYCSAKNYVPQYWKRADGQEYWQ